MKNIKLFLSLLSLTEEMANQLELSELSEADKAILSYLWKHNEKSQNFTVDIEEIMKICKVSKSQVYKSLKICVDRNIITTVNGPRDRIFKFV